MAVHACPFDLLDDDAMGSVLDRVRRDRLGNETIPGHVCEATSWRLLGKQFLAASIRYPSEFNGAITKSTIPHDCTEGYIDTFSGGKRYTRIPTSEPHVNAISMHCEGQMQLHIVRHPPTGRIFAITSFANREGHNAHMDSKQRLHLIPLPELARKLSGHTARFEERLNFFDKIAVFGKPHRVRATGIDPSSQQSITTNYCFNSENGPWMTTSPMRITFQVETTLRNELVFHVAGPTIRLTAPWTSNPASIPPQLDDAQPGETLAVVRTAEDAKRKSLSALSIAFGFYEPARIAECNGWLVSLWRDNLAAPALLSLPTRHDPTQGLRHRGDLAIAQAATERREVREATKRALTAYVAPTAAEKAEDRRQGSIVRHDGPAAALVIRPRKCTKQTVQSIKSIVKDMNQTHNSGRLHAVTQPWDSREDEATTGLVDDQYANPLDPESDSDDSEDGEDLAYVPPPTSRGSPGAASSSSDALLSDRLQRAMRMRQLVMIDSDDGSDDDESGGGDGGAALRAIAEDL